MSMTDQTRSDLQRTELEIGGMTCASCAARVEKRLNRLEGATASVNYATEKARIFAPPTLSVPELIAAVEQAGYSAQELRPAGSRPESAAPASAVPESPEDARDPSAAHGLAAMRQRLVVSALLSAPVIVLAMVPALQFTFWQWLSLTLAAPVVVWGAAPFHRAAWTNLRHGAATMDTLISMGTIAAFTWSLWALFLGSAGRPGMSHPFSLTLGSADPSGALYLEVAAGVTTFILAGRYFELRARRNAGAALRALLDLGAKDVTILHGGQEIRRPVSELAVGEEFVLRPGETVATDGEVIEGRSAVDVSMLTGEPVPAEVEVGDAVVGGAVNVGGRLVVRATRVGADTQLARIAALVEEAQNGKAAAQRLADRISAVFVPIVILLALATLIAWWALTGEPASAFTAAVAVLIIACPCALGLATPTALLVGTGRGAQLGILIRGPEVLESTRAVDTVVLDKTGTVTTGAMSVRAVHPLHGTDEAELLRLAGAVEHASEHPIGAAVARAARERLDVLPAVTGFENLAGRGVRGSVEGVPVLVGRPDVLREQGWDVTGLEDLLAACQGGTVIAVGAEGRLLGAIEVGDTVKATSAEAVRMLRALGLTPVLLTGDSRRAAEQVAREVGIEEVIAEVLPAEKVAHVRRLQESGRVVAMVGDGVNDAAALAAADLGLAMGTGTDAAIEASDLTLVRGDLRAAADAVRLSRRTLGTIKGNLFWAFAYNVAAIPVAALGLLNPMIAGAAMALSSVFVVTNSLRLRRFRSALR
ncbi:heavy metal translocating P-type ATPase [Ruania suaedae]|nr:heavy metal translocating P-type ATPase [Ruania suaedae]UFU03335.1 heavy metal translocating P-type ATPase [Ruania suaedae]